MKQPFVPSLYIHVPYCEQVCHYCDFAKTANYTHSHTKQYFHNLEQHLRGWLQYAQDYYEFSGFSSLFVGGGTPSLFANEFAFLQDILPVQEMTLEANPNHLRADNLKIWRQIGFDRLSIGVQTFNASGLRVLTRTHTPEHARQGIIAAAAIFPRVSIDLIYGWPGQTIAEFTHDLQQMLALPVTHVSLYNLIYEPGTVLQRKLARGQIQAVDEIMDAQMYEFACQMLSEHGWIHYEVSNWAKPGHESLHNLGYWSMRPYIGIGPGAHGYLPSADSIGWRYHYPKNDRIFSRAKPLELEATASFKEFAAQLHLEIDARTALHAAKEAVLSGLRTLQGVDVTLWANLNVELQITPILEQALRSGLLRLDQHRLYLNPSEWFREHAWAAQICDALYMR